MKLRHFREEEFDCQCGRSDCDAKPMQEYHLRAVDDLRAAWGKPLVVSSGRRCRRRNKAEGGAADSRHLHGDATDFKVAPQERYAFLALAFRHGFTGIGVGHTFVHLDSRPLGVSDYCRIWTY